MEVSAVVTLYLGKGCFYFLGRELGKLQTQFQSGTEKKAPASTEN
jgi:hypothetical protein